MQNFEGTAPLPQLTQAKRSKDGEGALVMTTLTRSALLYKLETDQFPKNLTELGLSGSTTQNYRYSLSSKANQLTLIARPKKAGLRSYIGVVVMQPPQENKYISGHATVCRSVRPAQFAPPMPKLTLFDNSGYYQSINCSSASEPVAF